MGACPVPQRRPPAAHAALLPGRIAAPASLNVPRAPLAPMPRGLPVLMPRGLPALMPRAVSARRRPAVSGRTPPVRLAPTGLAPTGRMPSRRAPSRSARRAPTAASSHGRRSRIAAKGLAPPHLSVIGSPRSAWMPRWPGMMRSRRIALPSRSAPLPRSAPPPTSVHPPGRVRRPTSGPAAGALTALRSVPVNDRKVGARHPAARHRGGEPSRKAAPSAASPPLPRQARALQSPRRPGKLPGRHTGSRSGNSPGTPGKPLPAWPNLRRREAATGAG